MVVGIVVHCGWVCMLGIVDVHCCCAQSLKAHTALIVYTPRCTIYSGRHCVSQDHTSTMLAHWYVGYPMGAGGVGCTWHTCTRLLCMYRSMHVNICMYDKLQCPITHQSGAPTPVSEEQLEELHLAVHKDKDT